MNIYAEAELRTIYAAANEFSFASVGEWTGAGSIEIGVAVGRLGQLESELACARTSENACLELAMLTRQAAL